MYLTKRFYRMQIVPLRLPVMVKGYKARDAVQFDFMLTRRRDGKNTNPAIMNLIHEIN